MLQYPSISKQIIDVPVYALDKIDESRIVDAHLCATNVYGSFSLMNTCEMCPNSLEAHNFSDTVCSRRCSLARKAKQSHTVVPCENCGKELERYKRIVEERKKSGALNYCSRPCMFEFRKRATVESGRRIEVPCGFCGTKLMRDPRNMEAKNLRGAFCSKEHRTLAKAKSFENRSCGACGSIFSVRKTEKKKACSHAHGMWLRNPGLIPLRLAWEKDPSSFMAAVQENCFIDDSGCWVARWTEDNYPYMAVPEIKATQLHRIVLIVTDRPPKDSVEQAHHTCANKRCVNPDHLQWLDPEDNLAEMKERGRYVLRIKRLEKTLREVSPNHPLLPRIYEEVQ